MNYHQVNIYFRLSAFIKAIKMLALPLILVTVPKLCWAGEQSFLSREYREGSVAVHLNAQEADSWGAAGISAFQISSTEHK